MSTSNKLTYLNETKQELKQAINNLGGSITDETTFREYVNQLDGVYDVLPKTSFQEGTSVTIEGGLKGKLDYDNGVVGIGQSSQDSTQGYQLFDITKKTSSTGTVINNGFKLVKSNNRVIRFMLNAIYPAGTYTLSMKQVSHISSLANYFYLNVQKKNGSDYDGVKNGIRINNSTDIETQIPGEFDTLYFYIDNGETDNAEVTVDDVMFETGTTAHEYEQYTGGQASPSPNWEQEVKCVAGRNILKDSGWERKTAWNETQIQDSTTRIMSDYIEVDEHLNYYATIQSTSYCFGNVVLYNANKVQFATYYNAVSQVINGTRSIGLKFPTNTKYARFVVRNTDNTSEVTLDELATIKPMLEQSTQATSYLPYNTIEEVVSGKNLLNLVDQTYTSNGITTNITSQNINVSGTASATWCDVTSPITQIPLNLEAGKTYTFWRNQTLVTELRLRVYDKDGGNSLIIINGGTNRATYTPTKNIISGYLYISGGLTSGQSFSISNLKLMVYEGNSDSSIFEPYKTPKTYQFSLGDHKFYGIGTYRDYIWTDRETKKWYKHSEIGEKIFTGASSENWLYWQGLILIDDTTIRSLGTSNTNFYLNYFRNVLSIAYIGSNTGQRLHINLSNSGLSEITTTTAWKTWLSTHNLEFVYVCNETDTEITGTLAEQLEEWWNGQTLNGTTIITSNGNLPMIIKVRALKGE